MSEKNTKKINLKMNTAHKYNKYCSHVFNPSGESETVETTLKEDEYCTHDYEKEPPEKKTY